MLGVVGLFLMVVIARLTDRAYLHHATLAGRASGFVARRVIDAIAVVGWLCDRLPMPAMRTAAVVRDREVSAPGRRAA